MQSNILKRIFTNLNNKIWFRLALVLISVIVPLLFISNYGLFNVVDSISNLLYGSLGENIDILTRVLIFTATLMILVIVSNLIFIILGYSMLFAVLNLVTYPKKMNV